MPERAHKPITNNDEWAAEASGYYGTIIARYLTGQRITLAEQRVIDVIRMKIGAMPESAVKYTARLLAQESKPPIPQVSQWD